MIYEYLFFSFSRSFTDSFIRYFKFYKKIVYTSKQKCSFLSIIPLCKIHDSVNDITFSLSHKSHKFFLRNFLCSVIVRCATGCAFHRCLL